MKNKRYKRLKRQIAYYLDSHFNEMYYWVRHEEPVNIYDLLNGGKIIKLYIPVNSSTKNGIYVDILLTYLNGTANLSTKIKIKSKNNNNCNEFDEFITEMFILNDHLSFVSRLVESFNLT